MIEDSFALKCSKIVIRVEIHNFQTVHRLSKIEFALTISAQSSNKCVKNEKDII